MGLKDIFKKKEETGVQSKVDDLISNYGQQGISFKLAKDIFSELKLSIHQEKAKCKKAYNDVSFVQTAVNNLMNVLEGEKPKIVCENEVIENYSKKWERFSGWKRARREAEQEAVITGDGYIRKIKGDKGSYKYQHIENSEDIYIDWNYQENRPNRYLQRVYYTQAQAKNLNIKSYQIKTTYGIETIFGIEYQPHEIIRFKFMQHSFGIYGRSPLASIIQDVDIMKRIERSIAVISMFKAIPQKILTPKQTSDTPAKWNQQQIKMIGEQLKNQKDYENSIVGTPIDTVNVTDSGQLIELTGYLDYFKRKISISLSPEFIIHGELVNRSTSVEQKQFFYLDVVSMRDFFLPEVEASLQEGLNASLNVLREQGIKIPNAIFYFEYGEFDVELREEKTKRLLQEWEGGLITMNEYREELGYEPDELFGENYKFDLMATQPQQQINKVKDIVNDKDEPNKETQKIDKE